MPGDGLGADVAFSSNGTTLAIGAKQVTDGVPPSYMRVLRFDGSNWIQPTVACGNPFYNNRNGMSSGLVRVYETDII